MPLHEAPSPGTASPFLFFVIAFSDRDLPSGDSGVPDVGSPSRFFFFLEDLLYYAVPSMRISGTLAAFRPQTFPATVCLTAWPPPIRLLYRFFGWFPFRWSYRHDFLLRVSPPPTDLVSYPERPQRPRSLRPTNLHPLSFYKTMPHPPSPRFCVRFLS